MNYIGALMIVLAATAAGILKALELKKRACTLREMLSILEIIKNEISARRTPINEIFALLSQSSYRAAGAFVCGMSESLGSIGDTSMCELWSGCVCRWLSILPDAAKSALISVGSSIGRYDCELQAAAIDRCVAVLTQELKEEAEGLAAGEKMYIGLGSGLGLIAALALI